MSQLISASVSRLIARMADSANPLNGVGMLAVNPSLLYAPGTPGDALRERISVNMCGGGAAKTAAQNTAAINIALAALAAIGGGGIVTFPDGQTYNVDTSISFNNLSRIVLDLCGSTIAFSGGAGTYLFDMTQAGQMVVQNGRCTGSAANHFLKTKGSAAAQALIYPVIPAETEWSRQLWFVGLTLTTFATVFDLQNFTREVWVDNCYVTGNTTAIKCTGKVVNLQGRGTMLYSGIASSQSIVVRGDAGDTPFRYAEGLFFSNCIADTQGIAVDVRDVFVFRFSGGQIRSAAGVVGLDITSGICPLTRDLFVSDVLMDSAMRFGNGLGASFLFQAKVANVVFSGVANTAIAIAANSKGVTVNGASFDGGTGAARMFSVGAGCTNIKLDALVPDLTTYVNAPTIDATSVAGVEAEFTASFTPGIAFGGSAAGITYATQSGRFSWRGGIITGYFEVALTNKGAAGAGAVATITGLPFVCNPVNGVAVVGRYSSMNTALTPLLDITKGTQAINVRSAGGGSESALWDAPSFSNGSVINGSFSYPVS